MSRPRGPDVVAAWGAGNAVLLSILIGYGDRAIAIALYAGSVALIEVIALVTWIVMRTHPVWAAETPALGRSRNAVLAAVAAGLVGAGLIWDWWMALPAVYALAAVGVDLAVSEPLEAPTAMPEAVVKRPLSAHIGEAIVAGGSAAVLAAAARAWRRRNEAERS